MAQALTQTNIDRNDVSGAGAQAVGGRRAGSSSTGVAEPSQSTASREALRRAYRRAVARESARKRWIGPFCFPDF